MERNDEYETLKEEYQGTQVYDDFVSFMDFLNPDWRKEKELGEWAPEFCLNYIQEYESLLEDEDIQIPFKAWLAEQYQDICERYDNTKSTYQTERLQNLFSQIDQEIESRINELTETEYDLQFELLRKKDDEKTYLNF
jgi:hypothetical protein